MHRLCKCTSFANVQALQEYSPAQCNDTLRVLAAPKYIVKSVSKHDPDNATAMDTFYSLFCPGEYIQCVMMAAGYGGIDHADFRWRKHFIHGRGLYSIERMQRERPDVWKLVSEQLAPGLEEWVHAVKAKGFHGLTANERMAACQAVLQWYLLEVFLQDSAVHFFEHRHSQVYLQLPIFQNSVFTEWLLRDFRQAIMQLEHEASICYKHIVAHHSSGTLLDAVCNNRPAVSSPAEAEAVLHEVYAQVMSDTSTQAAALEARAAQAAQAAAIQAAADRQPQAGRMGVITMPPKQAQLIELWEAWEQGWCGCQKLRIYMADFATYPRDAADRGSPKWLRNKTDLDAYCKVKELLLTLDRLVHARSNQNRASVCGVQCSWACNCSEGFCSGKAGVQGKSGESEAQPRRQLQGQEASHRAERPGPVL